VFSIGSIQKTFARVVRSVTAPAEKVLAAPVDTFTPASAKMTFASFEQAARSVVQKIDSVLTNYKSSDGDLLGGNGQAYPPSTPLSLIPPVIPQTGKATGPTIIYVNGAFDSESDAVSEMHSIADTTQSPVIGVYNANENLAADVVHVAEDMLDKGDSPSADTIAQLVYGKVKAGEPVVLYAHSQGGAIVSRALKQVITQLETQNGLTEQQAEARMSSVQVQTFGAASYDYPDGPQYVHYVNEDDPVPNLLGVGAGSFAHPGRGAVIHTASVVPSDPLAVHSMSDVYMPMWKAFNQA
jgi:hypothetical protein